MTEGRTHSPGDVIGYEPDGTPLVLAAAFCPRCGSRDVPTMDAHLVVYADHRESEWACDVAAPARTPSPGPSRD